VNHDYLLSKIHCPSSLKRDLKQWLKAGVLDNGVFEDTEAGTPQGGVISPILANIALLGMERLVKGGKDEYKNLQLLHRHCHDDKTALDNANAVSLTMEQSD